MTTTMLQTVITAVGPDVADLLEGGVLILFADGAPPELAEVSVLHAVQGAPSDAAPPAGAALRIGELSSVLTGIGPAAWAKVREIGHVVINFNGSAAPERPGELCAQAVDLAALATALRPGAELSIRH